MATLGVYMLPSGRTVEIELDQISPPKTENGGEFTPTGPGRVVQQVIEATLSNLAERNLIAGAVVEFGRARVLVRRRSAPRALC